MGRIGRYLVSTHCRSPKSDPNWRQFRLTVGAPDAEARFKTAINEAMKTNANAKVYPVIYVRIVTKPDTLIVNEIFHI